jgi:hypothetical protein
MTSVQRSMPIRCLCWTSDAAGLMLELTLDGGRVSQRVRGLVQWEIHSRAWAASELGNSFILPGIKKLIKASSA